MKLKREAAAGIDPDDVYAKLVGLGAGKSDRDARAALAALVMLLVNHIGDAETIDEAIAIASQLAPSRPRSAGT